MLFWQLATALMEEFPTGMLRIHGVLNGEYKGTSRLSGERTCVQLLNVTRIL